MIINPSDIYQAAEKLSAQITAWRRDIHQHPELRFEEVRTAGLAAGHLRALGLEVKTGVGKTGVTGLLRGAHPGPLVLLRVDMDALPIQEETGAAYASQTPGIMHACGHDTHVSMGMAAASILSQYRAQMHGNVRFVFQPAEEGAGGARAMIAEGVLENPKPDYAFGLHIDSTRPTGTVSIGSGYILAAADAFTIRVKGTGGHGALPEVSVDPLMAAVQIVTALQTVISRNTGLLENALISVCSFQSGSTFNVIPDSAELQGTIRTYEPQVQQRVHRRMREIVEHTALSFGASAEVEIDQIVPAAWNDPHMADLSRQIASQIPAIRHVETDYRVAPSDDLAEFLAAAPGCQLIIGAAPGEGVYHHNPRFDIDERAMPIGAALLCAVTVELLSGQL
jgi:amidohydrolase